MSLDFTLSSGAFAAGEHIDFRLYPGESAPADYHETGSGGATVGGSSVDDFFFAAGTGGALAGGSSLPEFFDSEFRTTSGGALAGGAVSDTFFGATVGGGALVGGHADDSESARGGALAGGAATVRVQPASAVELRYSMTLRVAAEVLLGWRSRVTAPIQVSYTLLNLISKGVEVTYGLLDRTPVRVAKTLPWNIRLQSATRLTYSIRPYVRSGIPVVYNLRQRVSTGVEISYGLPPSDRVLKPFRSIWSLLETSVVNVTDQPVLIHNGRTVRITEGDISISEGESAWQGNFALANIRDYVQFNRDDIFQADLYGEIWTFIVDGKELNRNAPAGLQCRIVGVSPSAQYATPRAKTADYTWDTNVYAHAAAEDVTDSSLVWNLVDWSIPSLRLAFSDAEPIEIVKRLAEAAGGVVEADLDGSLIVRHLFPVSPVDYAGATPDHVYVELADIVSVSEQYNYGEIANKFRLMDVQTAEQDNMEWIPDYDAALSGWVRVYPSPWRENVELTHTADPSELQIGPQVVQYREEEELVEIYKGQGSTTYPVFEILSYEWEATDLGGLSHAVDSKDVMAVGPAQNSLVRIRYRTRSLNYRANTSSGRPAQFLLESQQE